MDQQLISRFLQRPQHRVFAKGRLERLAGDASSRRYYRVHSGTGQAMILTVYPEAFSTERTASERLQQLVQSDSEAYLSFANDPLAQLEMSEFLADEGLDVPRVLDHDGKRHIIAFEDLGDTRLLEAPEMTDSAARLNLYKRAIHLVVKLQQLTPVLIRKQLIGARLEFSAAKLMWELDFLIEHYFGSYLKRPLSSNALEALRSELFPLCQWLAARPQVLCHRDYHARNLMLSGGRLYMIDFQDCRLGPCTYDLVSLLLDPYVPSASIDLPPLLNEYKAFRLNQLEHDFEEEFEAMAIQRLLKAAGTYAYQTAQREARGFETYLRPTLETALTKMKARGGFETSIELFS